MDAVFEEDVEYVCDFEEGDKVVYPHHGAGLVMAKETRELMGEEREYLTIKILHNELTVMVPCENAGKAGLRRVIDEEEIKKVTNVLTDDVSEMPKNWNRRFKYNREKIKTGDVFELAEVVRNLAIREMEKGLSTGEKQMYTRAKKILASEFMYALDKDEDGAEEYLDGLLEERGDVDRSPVEATALDVGDLAQVCGQPAQPQDLLVDAAQRVRVGPGQGRRDVGGRREHRGQRVLQLVVEPGEQQPAVAGVRGDLRVEPPSPAPVAAGGDGETGAGEEAHHRTGGQQPVAAERAGADA